VWASGSRVDQRDPRSQRGCQSSKFHTGPRERPRISACRANRTGRYEGGGGFEGRRQQYWGGRYVKRYSTNAAVPQVGPECSAGTATQVAQASARSRCCGTGGEDGRVPLPDETGNRCESGFRHFPEGTASFSVESANKGWRRPSFVAPTLAGPRFSSSTPPTSKNAFDQFHLESTSRATPRKSSKYTFTDAFAIVRDCGW